MRVALVHDWMTGYRGGEKVLEVLGELLPGADIYTIIHVPGSVPATIERHSIRASFLNRLPGIRRYYRYLLPLLPFAAGRLVVRDYDLVVAISHCVAHGVTVERCGRFVAYYLTPMRYAWDTAGSYFSAAPAWDPRSWVLRLFRPYLRAWDRRAAARVGEAVADCRNVQARIRACYGRDSAVIYPPVDTEFYRPLAVPREDFYLWVGALAPYKRVDLALEAFRGTNRRLVIIGDGQRLAWARRHAPRTVTVLGRRPDEVIRDHYARCRALIFPGEEDFGIVPLEAQACGTPVIAYAKGGALETVVDRAGSSAEAPTGVYFHDPTAASLRAAIYGFEARADSFDPGALRGNALSFSRERSNDAFAAYLLGRPER